MSRASTDLFPSDHLKYEPHHPALNDGPDVVEIIDSVHRARRAIDDALLVCSDKTERLRLVEDERRFAYGEAMHLFYHHVIRTRMFEREKDTDSARREFQAVEPQAERLRRVTDLVGVAGRDASSPNGLDASQIRPVYERMRKAYGQEPTDLR